MATYILEDNGDIKEVSRADQRAWLKDHANDWRDAYISPDNIKKVTFEFLGTSNTTGGIDLFAVNVELRDVGGISMIHSFPFPDYQAADSYFDRQVVFMRVDSIANHEAGHYVINKILSFDSTDLRLDINRGGGAATEVRRDLKTVKETITYCESRIKVLYAGAIAESVFNNHCHNDMANDLLSTTAKSDNDKARELLRLIGNLTMPADGFPKPDANGRDLHLSAIQDKLWKDTVQTVINEWDTIEALGVYLAKEAKSKHGKCTISKSKIDKLSFMIKRFGTTKSNPKKK